MNELRWEAWAALIAFVISLVYIWVPGPYPMGAFTFIAQPLFLVALLGYVVKVIRELRQRQVL
jgi:uncharacterized membrane protein YtjA (UPF0391 family)